MGRAFCCSLPFCSLPPCGGGLGRGVSLRARSLRYPPPHPSPTRGEGAGSASRNETARRLASASAVTALPERNWASRLISRSARRTCTLLTGGCQQPSCILAQTLPQRRAIGTGLSRGTVPLIPAL